MLKKIGSFLILLLLLSFGVDATGNIYQKHNISFQIPSNWSVAKDIQNGNDTQMVLSDNTSAFE